MKSKKILSLCLAGALSVTALCYPLSSSATVDYTYKIDVALAEKLESIGNTDTVDLSVWFSSTENENLVDYRNAKELTKVTENSNAIDYSEMQQENENNIENCIDELISKDTINAEQIEYVDDLLPTVDMTLTKNEIFDLIANDEIASIYETENVTFQTEEVDVNSVSSVTSVGIDDVNYGLYQKTGIYDVKQTNDGSGIKIGLVCDGVPDLSKNCFLNKDIHIVTNTDDEDECTSVNTISQTATALAAQIVGEYDRFEGVAPEATLYTLGTDSSEWRGNIDAFVEKTGVDVLLINYSTTSETNNTYGQASKWIDALINATNITVVVPNNLNVGSGNDIGSGGLSYNAVVVGEFDTETSTVSQSSSYNAITGLPYKPDLIAPNNTYIVYDDNNYVCLENASSSAAMVCGAIALLMDSMTYTQHIQNPALVKALVLNGTTYLGVRNVKNSTASTVAFNDRSGAGVLNIKNSNIDYSNPLFGYGNITAGTETYCTEVSVDSGLKPVHVTVCTVKENYFGGSGKGISVDNDTYTIRVTRNGDNWTSVCTVDNKCSVVFNPTERGTYQVYVTSNLGKNFALVGSSLQEMSL